MTKIKSKIRVRATGADIGNNSTKTSEGVCFPSKVTRGEDLDRNSLAIKVRWNDEFYILGDSKDAVKFRDTNKVYSNEYKVCLLAAIALSYPEEIINTIPCIGLPFDEWKKLRAIYRNEIMNLKSQEITIYLDADDNEGETKTINIIDCLVEPEGSIEDFISDDEIPAMVVDFGGRTLDHTTYKLTMTFVDGKQVKEIKTDGKTSNDHSFDEVLDNIRKELNSRSYTVDTDQDLIAILYDDAIETGIGTIDLKKIRDTQLKIYAHRVHQYLKNEGFIKYPRVFLIGGCSELVKHYLVTVCNVPEKILIVMPNSQFFNAINFQQQVVKSLDTDKYELIN